MHRDGLEDISSTSQLLEDYQGNLVEGQVISEEHLIESGRPPKKKRMKQIERLTEIWAATFTFPIFLLRLVAMGLFFGTVGGYAYFIGSKYKNDTWEACRHDGELIVCLVVEDVVLLIFGCKTFETTCLAHQMTPPLPPVPPLFCRLVFCLYLLSLQRCGWLYCLVCLLRY